MLPREETQLGLEYCIKIRKRQCEQLPAIFGAHSEAGSSNFCHLWNQISFLPFYKCSWNGSGTEGNDPDAWNMEGFPWHQKRSPTLIYRNKDGGDVEGWATVITVKLIFQGSSWSQANQLTCLKACQSAWRHHCHICAASCLSILEAWKGNINVCLKSPRRGDLATATWGRR